MTDPDPEIITTDIAAERLGLSVLSIRNAISRGDLKAVKHWQPLIGRGAGRQWRWSINPESLAAYRVRPGARKKSG